MKFFTSILLIAVLFLSCRTSKTHKTKEHTQKTEHLQDSSEIKKIDYRAESQLSRATEEAIMRNILSSLNLSFQGKSDNDRLFLHLRNVEDGLTLEIQGTGSAQYTQEENSRQETNITQLEHSKDSLKENTEQSYDHMDYHLDLDSKKKEKDKSVKGFTLGFVTLLVLVGIGVMVIRWKS